MSSPNLIRAEITQQIIASLEAGVVPWRRPWRLHPNAGPPSNAVSRRPYHGINILLLEMHAMRHNFGSKWWGTYDQIKALGGFVKRRPENVASGQWGCHIILYRPYSKTTVDHATGEEKQEERLLMKTFTVFNLDQTEGEALDRLRVNEEQNASATATTPDFSRAEQVITATKAEVRHGGEWAFYTRPQPDGSWPHHTSGDHITMPQPSRFLVAGAYFETLFHELAHWCEVRSDWNYEKEGHAAGELVAELAACFLSAELGIPHGEPLENHASYLQSWLTGMKGDSGLIFRASSQASKVADLILSHERVPVEQPSAIAATAAAP